jgi:hypothetical protein
MLKEHKYPKVCTNSAKEYFLSDIQLINFLRWIGFMAVAIDNTTEIINKALIDTAITPEDKAEAEKDAKAEKQKGMIDELKRNRLILMHMLHARMTDNYLTYLTSLLSEIFCCRPETLRSSETIKYEEVLKFQTIDDLVANLAEKKVHDLSYKSVTELSSFFQERLGIRLVPPTQENDLVKAVATRNIIAHNRGVRNRIYCTNVGEDFKMIGKVKDIGIEYIEKVNLMYYLSVKDVDSNVKKKFGIKGVHTDIKKEFAEKSV